jgi:di/tricarboxylate transporter
MSPIVITGLVVLGTMVMFVWNRVPVIVVALGTALVLWATGIVSLPEALAGFGDPSVLFIASLFVVSAALENTGVTAWVGQTLLGGETQTDPGKIMIALMGLAGLLTALISAGGAVAALIPIASVAAIRLKIPPSRLMMPIAFSAHAGANLVLAGAPKNVLVSEALAHAGFRSFGYFEFAWIGLPLLAGTMIAILVLGGVLLPRRSSQQLPADLSRHARVLVEQFGLNADGYKLHVREGSPLAGLSTERSEVQVPPGVTLVSVVDGLTGAPTVGVLKSGDMLLVRGPAENVSAFASDHNLAFRELDDVTGADILFNRKSGLAEVMIPPRSALVGSRVFPGMVTQGGDLAILAVQRNGTDVGDGGVELTVGDVLLLQGTWRALDQRLSTPEMLLIDSPDLVRRQAVPVATGAWLTIAVLAAMVMLLATGALPPAVVGLCAAGTLVAAGVMTPEACYRSIHWTTIILVAALMPLSTAIEATGSASLLGAWLVNALGPWGPTALLAGLFVATASLGQVMSNTATTLIVIPIALSAAKGMGISPHPVMMSLCVAGSAAFLTPIATSANLMVMGPGGYQFGDYWRLGLPLMMLYLLVAVLLVPLVWPF